MVRFIILWHDRPTDADAFDRHYREVHIPLANKMTGLRRYSRSTKLPKIFHVNWFRRDSGGRFLWPGYGENLRVLRWMIDRCEDRVGAVEAPIGYLPKPGDIDLEGLDVPNDAIQQLLAVDPAQWRVEMDNIGQYFDEFGDRVPKELRAEHQKILRSLS